ncbi:MAG: hypothetical protein AAF990_17995 [Bacteroidota bacterium]
MRKHVPAFQLMVFLFLSLCGASRGMAQQQNASWGTNYPAVDERLVVETKWRYTYALHLESNTIIHQAEDFYDYYLYFRYDYLYEQYLNGKMSRGNWSIGGSELFYSFKHIKKFEFAEINKETMVLEFTQSNSKGTYQYHFIRVESQDAPFVKPANELPDVIVEREDPRKGFLSFNKKKKRKKKKKKRKKGKSGSDDQIYISIELIGGGYYGGVDPVLRDYIHIKSNGRLIKEFKSVYGGLLVTKKNIPRDELEKFAEYIVSKGFFGFDRMYDCEDNFCQKRKHTKPTPIPLRLAVAYGNRKKVVTIGIWGKDDKGARYLNYPPAIDNIIEAIQKMAHRIGGDS